MKIAFVSMLESTPWGGSEELWSAAAAEALEAGHEVAVFVARWPILPPRLAALQLRGAQIIERPVCALARVGRTAEQQVQRHGPRVHRLWLEGVERLSPFRHLLRWQPDVICINQGGTYNALYRVGLMQVLRRLAVPYIVTCRWNSDAVVLDLRFHEEAIALFTGAAAIAFASEGNRRTTERQLARRFPQALTLPPPVRFPYGAPLPWPEEDVARLATVARLCVEAKGQDLLLEALAADPPWPQRDWRLTLYGEGEDRPYLERLATYYGLNPRIRFAGVVEDVRQVWRENHLLVLPSRSEGTPTAMLEALLCGRPTLITDVGGAREWLKEGIDGFVAEAPTVYSLRTALERAWAARPRWEAMGRDAHRRASALFDSGVAGRLLRVLEGAAGH